MLFGFTLERLEFLIREGSAVDLIVEELLDSTCHLSINGHDFTHLTLAQAPFCFTCKRVYMDCTVCYREWLRMRLLLIRWPSDNFTNSTGTTTSGDMPFSSLIRLTKKHMSGP